jgi:DNA mismatch endonuclease (patch repair protein)
MMSGIRGKNTRPEIRIRKSLHAAGYRYRLHGQLPGKPDLVFPGRKAVLFVNGCFWHGHGCHLFRLPATRSEFWQAKIASNISRDARAIDLLHEGGWRVGTVWECALRGRERLFFDDVMDEIGNWLNSGQNDLLIRGDSSNAKEKSPVTGPDA